jgi:ApbE superfamily uncharacterized protein (UPF0280 family)
MWESRILNLGDDTIFVECGPMRLFIDGSRSGTRKPDLCAEAARQAIGYLSEIAEDMPRLQNPTAVSPRPNPLGRLGQAMWQAASLIGDADLTPMAAVAGVIADATADFLWTEGLTRVIVNNGGDLALRVGSGETVTVGIRDDITRQTISHRIVITPESGVGGVCTSGLGGRSFTRGVASAAIVLARRAALADAAATAIANATYVSSPSVERAYADTIDPQTDLKGILVTVSVGTLEEEEIQSALNQAMAKAETLANRDVIAGACVFVQGRSRSTSGLPGLLVPCEH